MNTAELAMERGKLRVQLRRAWCEGSRYELPIDREAMLDAATESATGALGIRTRRRLIVRALVGSGIPPGVIAEAWNTTVENVQRWAAEPLVDASGAAAAIDEEVEKRFPTRVDPDRFVRTTGERAQPGIELVPAHRSGAAESA